MKRILCLMLAVLLMLSLTVTGCRSSQEGASSGSSLPVEDSETEETMDVKETEPAVTTTLATVPKEDISLQPPLEGDLVIENTGGLRVVYTGNVSSVRYITSASQLPDYPELAVYDEAYFREHALVLVMETVTNGTVEVGISGIDLEGNTATVRLSHELKGDVSTTVMTTWLLWAEVETGLEYSWSVGNPAIEPENKKY